MENKGLSKKELGCGWQKEETSQAQTENRADQDSLPLGMLVSFLTTIPSIS